MSHIPRRPQAPPPKTPHDERYWDPRDLEAELRRAFQICHECRMCVGYCGTFPSVFHAVDRDIESGKAEGAEATTYEDFKKASNLCWQCKLCYIKCPYTEDEGASELLDFPRLMAREKAVRARRDGVALVDQILGEPGLIGAAGAGPQAPLANLINANKLVRKIGEKVAGISAEFPIPPLAPEPFPTWMKRHTPAEATAGEVVLFATCYGDFNEPSVVRAAVKVLEHQGYRVHYEPMDCCGMPNLDGGDVESAMKKIRANVERLIGHAKKGRNIVVPSPTCGYTMKKEWHEYVPTDACREVSLATKDLMEFLEGLRRKKTLKTDFAKGLGKVAYHAACHLRAQKIAFPGMRLLSQTPGTEVRLVEKCSAVDGTWGMKAEFYEMGRKYAGELIQGIADSQAELVVTDCQLSGRRIGFENRVRVIHPVEAMAEAYGLDFT